MTEGLSSFDGNGSSKLEEEGGDEEADERLDDEEQDDAIRDETESSLPPLFEMSGEDDDQKEGSIRKREKAADKFCSVDDGGQTDIGGRGGKLSDSRIFLKRDKKGKLRDDVNQETL